MYDLMRIVRELREERDKVDQAIKLFEAFASGRNLVIRTTARRGRKPMSEQERRKAAERMRRYWDQRRRLHQGVSELPRMMSDE